MRNRAGNGKDDDIWTLRPNRPYSDGGGMQCKDGREGWDSRPVHTELKELSQ